MADGYQARCYAPGGFFISGRRTALAKPLPASWRNISKRSASSATSPNAEAATDGERRDGSAGASAGAEAPRAAELLKRFLDDAAVPERTPRLLKGSRSKVSWKRKSRRFRVRELLAETA